MTLLTVVKQFDVINKIPCYLITRFKFLPNTSTGQIGLTFIGIITEYPSNHLFDSYSIVSYRFLTILGNHDCSIGFLCQIEILAMVLAYVSK